MGLSDQSKQHPAVGSAFPARFMPDTVRTPSHHVPDCHTEVLLYFIGERWAAMPP